MVAVLILQLLLLTCVTILYIAAIASLGLFVALVFVYALNPFSVRAVVDGIEGDRPLISLALSSAYCIYFFAGFQFPGDLPLIFLSIFVAFILSVVNAGIWFGVWLTGKAAIAYLDSL